MKHRFFIFLLIFIVFVVCSNCVTTEIEIKAMKSLYSISENEINDIQGNYKVYRLLIFKKTAYNSVTIITFDKIVKDDIYFTIIIEYTGKNWLFIDELQMKSDTEYYKISCNNPYRKVNDNPESWAQVSEIASFPIIGKCKDMFISANTLKMQYSGNLFEIPAEGIQEIKKFLMNE